jgi:hypothetical protein
MAKKTFRMSARIVNCDKILEEGFERGVFVTQDVVFDLTEEEYKSARFITTLMDRRQEFLEENVEASIEEVI